MIAFRKTLGQKLDEISARIAPEIKALAKLSPDDLKMALGAHESQQSEADKERRRIWEAQQERDRLQEEEFAKVLRARRERLEEERLREEAQAECPILEEERLREARDEVREDYEDHQF